MARILVLAEKPSLMRKIKEVGQTMEEFSQTDYVALHGHLTRAKYPNELDPKWEKWSFETLPILPEKLEYTPSETGADTTFERIKKLTSSKKYDFIVNACDPEREGQAIFQNVYDTLGLNMPIKRFWTNDLQESSIRNALKNLRYDGDGKKPDLKCLTSAALLRQNLDYAFGMNGSRAATLKRGDTIHVGRIKFAIDKMTVDRELAIRNFVPTTSYGLEAIFDGFEGIYVIKDQDEEGNECYEKKLWSTENEAKEVASKVQNPLNVISVKKDKVTNIAPALYTTSDIQSDASRIYGYSVGETLEVLQNLYEREITSYPRTDNNCISTELCATFPNILQALEVIPEVSSYANLFKNDNTRHEKVKKTKKYVNDKKMAEAGHYAIIPTGKKFSYDSLTASERNILKLIAQRFVSIFANPLTYETKEIIFGDNDDNYFKTNGKTLLDIGYYEIINQEFHDKKLPNLKEGDRISFSSIGTYESTTTAPSRFTDGTLLSAMANPTPYLKDSAWRSVIKEVKGIGTEATRSGIVQDLIDQGYLELKAGRGKAKQIHATEKSIKIMQELGDTIIASVDMTAMWESKLSMVERGEMSEKEFKDEMNQFILSVIDELKNSNLKTVDRQKTELAVLGKCPLCGEDVIAGKKYYFCKNYRKEKDCKFILGREVNGASVNEDEVRKILEGKETKAFKMKNKDGKVFNAKLKWDSNEKKLALAFENKNAPKETKLTCPICGKSHLNSAKGQYGNYYKCPSCAFIFSETVNKHKLNAKEIKALMSGNKTEPIEFTKKDGTGTYKAMLYLDKNEKKIKMEFESRK